MSGGGLLKPTKVETLGGYSNIVSVLTFLPSCQTRSQHIQRILVLTGPAGAAKTTTVKILARELGIGILEWKAGQVDGRGNTANFEEYAGFDDSYEAVFSKFEGFISRAASCGTVFGTETDSQSRSSQQAVASSSTPKRRLILLEDLPNILHAETRSRFHELLKSLLDSPPAVPVPVVIIVSDSGLRGEASDELMMTGAWSKDNDSVVDIRAVLGKDLLHGHFVTQIRSVTV
jgi:cell cycle checkpoint protein